MRGSVKGRGRQGELCDLSDPTEQKEGGSHFLWSGAISLFASLLAPKGQEAARGLRFVPVLHANAYLARASHGSAKRREPSTAEPAAEGRRRLVSVAGSRQERCRGGQALPLPHPCVGKRAYSAVFPAGTLSRSVEVWVAEPRSGVNVVWG